MKKILGFFSVLGLTSSLSASPVTAFSDNNYDWATPVEVLESLSKITTSRVFKDKADFENFINSEVFGRFTHIIKNDADTYKPGDIVLEFKLISEKNYEFNTSIYEYKNEEVVINKDMNATKLIVIDFE